MAPSKFYLDINEKSLMKWIRQQAKDYFNGMSKDEFKEIIEDIVKKYLDSKDLKEIVKESVREVLPTKKVIKNGIERYSMKTDWIYTLLKEEIAKKVKESMPHISIKVNKGFSEIFDDK